MVSPEDAVILIHGTFAHRDEDDGPVDPLDPVGKPAWWQANSEFVAEMDTLLLGHARCWPAEVCEAMPWATPTLGSRLSAWTILGKRPFGWARPKRRIHSRRLFAWSGLNSENERRKAGRRLFDGLVHLERENARAIAAGEPPRSYHLVGHSHGGSIIWNALRTSAANGEELPHLRSWTTLGTPFPTYGPVRFRWLIGLLGLLTIAGIAVVYLHGDLARIPGSIVDWRSLLAIRALFSPNSPANLYPYGVSPGTAALLTALGAMAGWFAFAVVTWIIRRRERARDDRASKEAWRRFGRRWLGLFSRIDEAIAGTQNTVGLYASDLVRIPWPSLPPMPPAWNPLDGVLYPLRLVFWIAGWLVVPLMNLVALPLAEWVISLVFRLKFQGSDRLGAYLTLMSPEPFSRASFPDTPARGPLPPSLADPLHELARRQVESKILVVRGRFADDARSPRSPKELLHDYFSNVKITHDLIHNAYHDGEEIRRAIAYHILRSASLDVVPEGWLGLAAEARAWLDGEVPAPVPPDYLPRPKPPSATPLWTRGLLTTATVLLCVLALGDLAADLQGPYIDLIVQKLTNPDEQSGVDDADLLWKAYEMFRPRTEPRLVQLVIQRDLATPEHGLRSLRRSIERQRRSSPLDPTSIRRLIRFAYRPDTDRKTADGVVAALLELPQPDRRVLAYELGEFLVHRDLDSDQSGGNGQDPVLETDRNQESRDRVGNAILMTLECLGPDALPGLDRILDHSQGVWYRRKAANTLKSAGRRILDSMRKRLSDRDVEVRKSVQVTIRSIGPEAVGGLSEIVSDPKADTQARIAAATLLAEFGPDAAPAFHALRDAIASAEGKDGEPLRFAAVTALSHLGLTTEAVLGVFTERLRDPHESSRILRVAASSLGRLGPAAVPILVAAARGGNGPARDVIERSATLDQPSFSTLLAHLDDPDPRVPYAIMACLERNAQSAAPPVEKLIDLLNSPRENLRYAALGVLPSMGARAAPAVDFLIGSLKGDALSRLIVYETLGEIGPPAARAVGELTSGLKSKKHNERLEATRAITLIGSAPRSTIDALLENMSRRGDNYFMGITAEALVAVGHGSERIPLVLGAALKSETDRERRHCLILALRGGGESAVGTLIGLLDSDDNEEKAVVAKVLADIGTKDPAAIRAFLHLLPSSHQLEPVPTAPDQPLLKNSDLHIHGPPKFGSAAVQAARALGKVPVPSREIVEALVSCIPIHDDRIITQDPRKREDGLALEVLKALAPSVRTAAERLGKILLIPDDQYLRGSAIDVELSERKLHAVRKLLQIGPAAGVAAEGLIESLKISTRGDADAELRMSTVKAIGRIRPQSDATIRALADALRSKVHQYHEGSVKDEIVSTLEASGDTSVTTVEALSHYLRTVDGSKAAKTLGGIASKATPPVAERAIAALREALDSKDQDIRMAAAEALLSNDATDSSLRRRSIEVIVKALWTDPQLAPVEPEIRLNATRALARAGSQAISSLNEMLLTGDDDLKAKAADTLALMGSDAREAVPHLIGLTIVGNREARGKAENALRRIGPIDR